MMMPQQYCLRWKHHHTNVQSMFSQLLEKERFCDVTLYCSPSFTAQLTENGTVQPDNIKGVSLRAHRVVLASCSELLATLLGAHETHGEPVLVIDGADPKHVRQLLDYMYTGEMNVHHSQLASLLKTAEDLRIKGLTDIRWNNKDEPPDCQTGSITTTAEPEINMNHKEPTKETNKLDRNDFEEVKEKFNVNGGPPPLIKLTTKEKTSPTRKRESLIDSESQSPKRKRVSSGTLHSDDEDKDNEWHHGSMDITAERVVNWGPSEQELNAVSWDRTNDLSDDEWADAPTDIGSFLHTNLKVDGDVSEDDEGSIEECPSNVPVLSPSLQNELKKEAISNLGALLPKLLPKPLLASVPGIKSTNDPRFGDVIKLNDYLLHGRRPQFWEEDYVKRVMEAVRLKELEMKQAAEILGVSYGTLYGRYRDVYGCINRPYRNVRDHWMPKSDVLEKLERNEVSLKIAAQALGVPVTHLATYCSEIAGNTQHILPDENNTQDDSSDLMLAPQEGFGKLNLDFEPIPIEIDPSIRKKPPPTPKPLKKSPNDKSAKKILIGSLNDEESIPATVITTQDSGKWPAIRVASIDSLRGSSSSSSSSESTSPTLLMKSRPDLTIVAAKKSDSSVEDDNTNGT